MTKRMHKRVELVTSAELALASALYDVKELEKLTVAEEIQVITRVLADAVRARSQYLVKLERHGEKSPKRSDEA